MTIQKQPNGNFTYTGAGYQFMLVLSSYWNVTYVYKVKVDIVRQF